MLEAQNLVSLGTNAKGGRMHIKVVTDALHCLIPIKPLFLNVFQFYRTFCFGRCGRI